MKITATGFEFNDFKAFKRFAVDQELVGSISLEEAIVDNNGNVLIKEKVTLKESMMKKLEEMEGQFLPLFKLSLTDELLKKIKFQISKAVYKRFEDKTNHFLNFIYKESEIPLPNFRGIIFHAFCTKSLTLIFFRILIDHPNFFNHCADLGLLSMGSVIQKKLGIKMVNRYSFLAGLLADLCLVDTDYWKTPLNGKDVAKYIKHSSQAILKLKLHPEIADAINGHPIPDLVMDTGTEDSEIDFDSLSKGVYLTELINTDTQTDTIDEESPHDEGVTERTVEFATEALRVGRYIMENLKSSSEKDQISEKLLVMFTYNVEKGYFKKEVANLVISQFKMFDTVIQRIRIVSEIENKCKFPTSAWAYPKPKAAQILCKNSHYECPLIVAGWDIRVITSQEAFGYIGTNLKEGSYPKCHLEEELKERLHIEPIISTRKHLPEQKDQD
ncbi:MAG: hypothetical protein GW938_09350 [Leptospira sp.]|nr:hypothetical protein [Leptospira sp.]NCS95648.1 hypothetical protein [Leptospira sp.]